MHSWKMMKSQKICLYVTVVRQIWRIFEKKIEKIEKIVQETYTIVVKKTEATMNHT